MASKPKPKVISDPDHHFVKHFKNRELIRDGLNGPIIGVYPDAFVLRQADSKNPEEKWLSGQYYEFYDGTREQRLCACCHFIPLELKKKDALGRLTVGKIKEQGEKRGKQLRVQHAPEAASPGYSRLHGLPKASDPADDELNKLLAALAVIETAEISTIL